MLYEIAHFLSDRMPWLWDLVDMVNSALFSARFGSKLKEVEEKAFEEFGSGYRVVRLRDVPTEKLVEFFAHQPEEAFRFFKPHGFDAKSIKKLQRNKAFLGYVVLTTSKTKNVINHGSYGFDGCSGKELSVKSVESVVGIGTIAGYCFNRSFFHGKGFRGRMVGIDYRGRGLGTMMNKMLNEVGFGIGLRLFETVNKDNVASYRSAVSASKFKVVEELPHNELYIEIINDMKQIGNQNVIDKNRGVMR